MPHSTTLHMRQQGFGAPLDHVAVAPPPHDYRPIRRAFAGFLIGIALLLALIALPFAIIVFAIGWAYWEALSWLLR